MADKLEIIIGAKNLTGRAFATVGVGIKKLGASLKRLSVASIRTLKRMALVGVGGFAAMVKGASDFRTQMALVNTVMNKGDIKKCTNDVIDLSAKLGVAKKELAEGLYATLSAGIPEENALTFLETAANAAIGGATDVGTAVTALSKVMEAYGDEAGSVTNTSDALFSAVKQGQVTFEQLAQGIGNVAGISASAGVSMDELFGVIAQASKQGGSTERTLTGIKAAIQAIQAPSEDLKKAFDKAFGQTGQEILGNKGLVEALLMVEKLSDGSADKMKKLIPSMEAMPVITSLIGKNSENARKAIAKMADKMGEAAKATKKMQDVRGWPRLWQSILAPITKVGVIVDEKLQPAINVISKAMRDWGKSDAGVKLMASLTANAERLSDLVGDIFSGDEAKRNKAISELTDAGSDFADKVIEKMLDGALMVGSKIGEGIANAAKIKRESEKIALTELGKEGKATFSQRTQPFIANLLDPQGFGKRLETRAKEVRARTGFLESVVGTTAGLTPDAQAIIGAINNQPKHTVQALKAD